MGHDPRIIHVPDNSELARLLEDAELASLRLERGGVLYRVSRDDVQEPNAARDHSAHAAVRHLTRAIGSWKRAGVDAEAFKLYIAERRKTANRPSVRL